MNASEKVKRWRKSRPHCDGWWLYREGGRRLRERLLLVGNGECVASDEEWEAATGKPATDGCNTFNYWEDTDTTQETMPGLWMYEQPATNSLLTADDLIDKEPT